MSLSSWQKDLRGECAWDFQAVSLKGEHASSPFCGQEWEVSSKGPLWTIMGKVCVEGGRGKKWGEGAGDQQALPRRCVSIVICITRKSVTNEVLKITNELLVLLKQEQMQGHLFVNTYSLSPSYFDKFSWEVVLNSTVGNWVRHNLIDASVCCESLLLIVMACFSCSKPLWFCQMWIY